MEYNSEILRININKMFEDNAPTGCGYCKHQKVFMKNHNKSQFRFPIKSIPVNILQNMLSRGWGRS